MSRPHNERVVNAEKVERPKASFSSSSSGGGSGQSAKDLPFYMKHSGTKVTTDAGNQYLVHKGRGYGKSSQTVVTDARNMSSAWNVTATKDVTNAKVGDYVKAGGSTYGLVHDNCHHASGRMMKLD